MIDVEAFGVGLGKLASATRQPLDKLTLEVYHQQLEALSGKPPHDQDWTADWEAYVAWCLDTSAWPELLPKLEELKVSFLRWRRDHGRGPAQLAADTRTPEELQAERARGVAAFRAELERRGFALEQLAKSFPAPQLRRLHEHACFDCGARYPCTCADGLKRKFPTCGCYQDRKRPAPPAKGA